MLVARLLILVCFLIAFTLSISGWFERFTSADLFGMGSFLSAGGFVTLYWLSQSFRGFLRARRGIRRLTLCQTMRFYGLLALIKTHQHVLPAIFAVPTGLLDLFFAITSFFVAAKLVTGDGRARPGFVVWHIAGLGALGVSTLLAVLTSSPRSWLVEDGITSQPMTWFPMSLVPVFIGPMVLIFHLLALTAVHANRNAAAEG
jgi:hypothetical protein